MTRVPVKPELFRWARERAGLAQEDLAGFKKLPEWESGAIQPTLKQLEAFARAVHVPVGCLFLSSPPEESIPIPDYRTFDGRAVTRPSPNLLDTIYICQERQSWYRDFVQETGQPELGFVGRVTVKTRPETAAARMRETLGFNSEARQLSTWEDALRLFVRQISEAGVLVMISGVVMSNNRRPLVLEEFRGFALSDLFAPLIFVNGKDTRSAQMFTLAHELAHIWLGESALSNLGAVPRSGFRPEETWCNAVAAEFLVPMASLRGELQDKEPLPKALSRLTRIFKVSNLVILRRLLDAKWLTRERFDGAWVKEVERLHDSVQNSSGGGNFYHTTLARVNPRFVRALIASTLEGRTLYRDAFRMLGISKTETFNNLGREVADSSHALPIC